MALIGIFAPTSDGFTGHIKTLLLDAKISLARASDRSNDNAPDYRITLGGKACGQADSPIIGAAWSRKTDKGGDYVALVIDDPLLVNPINAVLFPTDKPNMPHHLYWTRSHRRDDKA